MLFICKTVEDRHVRLQSNVTAGVYARISGLKNFRELTAWKP
jgi:hypothetical protein